LTPAASFSTSSPPIERDDEIVFGFIGLGNMGFPMASNLRKQTVPLVVFDTNPETCRVARENGMVIASKPEEIITRNFFNKTKSGCSLIFTMLPGCNAIHATMNQLFQVASTDVQDVHCRRVFVDCSTVSPSTSKAWHKKWIEKGHDMLDAPVSGGVKGATDATLTFMVGSEESRGWQVAKPYLDFMGSRIVFCGGPGAGSATKLCNNLALASQMIGICEAMNLGEALGVDPIVLSDVMNTATAKCWSSEVNNPHPKVAAKRSSPAANEYKGGFGSKLMLKDLGLAVQSANEVGVSLPITSQAKELYRLIDAHGLGDKDFGVMLQFLRGKRP